MNAQLSQNRFSGILKFYEQLGELDFNLVGG